MNQFEEIVLHRVSDGTMPISGTEDFMMHPGVSRLVAEMIITDVHSIYPGLNISNLRSLAEFANKLAADDGLIATSNLDLPLTRAYERLNSQIALTTIWVAQFTRMQAFSRCRSLAKKQREFQICLLVYFFNQIIGSPPSNIRKKVESITVKEYGLQGWYFNNSQEHDLRKISILFDIMHMCSLEYWTPEISV